MAFKIFANALVLEPDFNPVQRGFRKNANVGVTSSFDIKAFSPKEYLFSHCTIIASVDTDPDCEHHITLGTEKYINQNYDSWTRGVVKNSYKTFIGAPNYVEHVQVPELSKGTIVDALLRDIKGETLYCDILVATHRKHAELVHRIKTGSMKAMSMGCIAAFTLCTKCGNKAHNEEELCEHVKRQKGTKFMDKYGNLRTIAELCGSEDVPDSVRFIEASWVEIPAFSGAVLRNVVSLEEGPKVVKLAQLTNPFSGLGKTAAVLGPNSPKDKKTEEQNLDSPLSPEQQDAELDQSLEALFGKDNSEDNDALSPTPEPTEEDSPAIDDFDPGDDEATTDDIDTQDNETDDENEDGATYDDFEEDERQQWQIEPVSRVNDIIVRD